MSECVGQAGRGPGAGKPSPRAACVSGTGLLRPDPLRPGLASKFRPQWVCLHLPKCFPTGLPPTEGSSPQPSAALAPHPAQSARATRVGAGGPGPPSHLPAPLLARAQLTGRGAVEGAAAAHGWEGTPTWAPPVAENCRHEVGLGGSVAMRGAGRRRHPVLRWPQGRGLCGLVIWAPVTSVTTPHCRKGRRPRGPAQQAYGSRRVSRCLPPPLFGAPGVLPGLDHVLLFPEWSSAVTPRVL